MTDRRQRLFILVTVLAVAMFGWNSIWLWPLKVMVVLFHELGHALMALLTGGTVVQISLSPDQGGLTLTQGGMRFLILNAGYLGSLAFGTALLGLSRSTRSTKLTLFGMSALLVFTTVWWVRPLVSFGFGFSLVASAAVVLLALKGHERVQQGLLQAVGIFSVLYALWDIRSDVFRVGSDAVTDATMLAEYTYIPASVWGGLWLGTGVIVLWLLRRWWW